jgi:hypothetical protein
VFHDPPKPPNPTVMGPDVSTGAGAWKRQEYPLEQIVHGPVPTYPEVFHVPA